MVINIKKVVKKPLYDFSDDGVSSGTSGLKDTATQSNDSSNVVRFPTSPCSAVPVSTIIKNDEDNSVSRDSKASAVSGVVASVNVAGSGGLSLGSVSEGSNTNNTNASSFVTKVCDISKDPRTYASFLFNSFASSGVYGTGGGGVSLDLHALLRAFIGWGKESLNNADFNAKKLSEIELVMGDAVSIYNAKRSDKSKLLLEIDNVNSTVYMNRKLHYSDVEELISYVHPKGIDEKIKIECRKTRAIKNIMSIELI